MPAPIPPNKWSWKYNRCMWCGTKSKKGGHLHKGKGLCLNCYDKKRAEEPRRKKIRKKANNKYYIKNKDTEEYKIKNKNSITKYYNSDTYRKFLKKKYVILSFQRIILNQATNAGRILKRNQGLKVICDGCERHCIFISPIKPPTTVESENNTTIRDIEIFKKQIIKLCKKNNQ